MGPRMAPVGSIAAAAVAGIAGTAHFARGVGAWAGTTHSPSCAREGEAMGISDTLSGISMLILQGGLTQTSEVG